MKRIALIIPPPFWLKTPHIGLEFIKKFNESFDVEIDIFDLNMLFFRLSKFSQKKWLKLDNEFEQNLYFYIKEKFNNEIINIKESLKHYDYIGFSIFKRNKDFSVKFISELQSGLLKTHFVAGGPQTRENNFKNSLQDNISIVIGEGEIPWQKIIYENQKGVFSYEEIDDLDKIPFLDFKGFNTADYKPIFPLLSSRGCIRKCLFCSEYTLYKEFRKHSVDYICNQIEALIKAYNIKHFSFQDSLFNSDIKWLEEFCLRIKKFDIRWESQMIIRNDMDDELLNVMKESGAINIFIGFESGSDKVLHDMNKGFNTNDAALFFKKLSKFEINFEISIIVGYPTETDENFIQTLRFLKENKKNINRIAQISLYTKYDNSKLAKSKLNQLDRDILNKRLRIITNFVERNKIPHKKAFINNL